MIVLYDTLFIQDTATYIPVYIYQLCLFAIGRRCMMN